MNPSRNKPTLLIVDDDQIFLSLVTAAAERTGQYFDVRNASDGQAALHLISDGLHGEVARGSLVVLSDLSMPHVDGLQFLQAMKQNPATHDVPVSIMTSSNRPNDQEDAVAAGCSGFYYKPARFDEILSMVANVPRTRGAQVSAVPPTPRAV